MRLIFHTAIVLLSLSLLSLRTQSQQELVAYLLPREYVLPTVAWQPECPLKVELAEAYGYTDSGWNPVLVVKNAGRKTKHSHRNIEVE